MKINKKNLIKEAKEKYQEYLKYLSDNFFNEVFFEFSNLYNYDCGISEELYFKIYLESKVNKELVIQVNKGDIDLEINLINKFLPTLNYIVNKKNLYLKDKEAILIAAIESYDGTKMFSLHLLDIVRRKTNTIEILDKFVDIKELQSFDEKIEHYISGKEWPLVQLSYIDSLVIKFGLIDLVNDERLKKYIYLKFGYHNNLEFSDLDILEVLNISINEQNDMYKTTLLLLKQILNENIDLIVDNYSNKIKQKSLGQDKFKS